MHIFLVERIVKRENCRCQKVVDMSSKTLEVYESQVIPRVGDTIVLDDYGAYDVVSVVYTPTNVCYGKEAIFDVYVEVKPHSYKNAIDNSFYYIEEDWPLITDI